MSKGFSKLSKAENVPNVSKASLGSDGCGIFFQFQSIRVTAAKCSFSQTRHRSHDLRTKSLAARLSVQPLPLLVCLGYGYGRGFKERRVALYIDPFNKYKWYKATDKISNYS